MAINDRIPNFKEPKPQRRNQRHGRSRQQPAHSSVQARPASNAQSGSAETTPSALFNSAMITGGQFTTAANANHRNVTININASTEGVPPQPQIQNRHLRQTTNRNRNRRTALMPDPPGPVQRSNEIYERHLRLKKRGHPLWIPQSNMVLPIPYRAQGVRVGDVGIFTENGGFDFLFNICVRRDDPINPRNLPENFIPISPPVDPTDIRKFAEFSPSSYLASSSVAESRTAESSGLIFESSASEGAILTMPEGAYSEDLSNFSRLRQYIAIHAEDWYKFVNGPRGREAQNGDLHVVVGCDKTTSWGMATFADSSLSQETSFRLKFSALGEQQSQRNAGNKYMWEHSGVAEVRVGPGRGENEELGETDSNRLRNQCLFLRTLNVTLSEKVWEEIFPYPVTVADQNPHSEKHDHPKCCPQVMGHSHLDPSWLNSSQNLRSGNHNSTNSQIPSIFPENLENLNDLVPPNLMSPFGNLNSHDVVDGLSCLSSMFLHEEMEQSFDSGPSTNCFTDMFLQDHDVLESTSKKKCVTAFQLSSKEGTNNQISSDCSTSPNLGRYEKMHSTPTPNVTLTRSASCNSVLHPSKIINQCLLKHVPQARVAVTHDKDWSSIIDVVSCHSDPSQMFSLVCSMNDIVLDNDTGLVYLELKENNENGVSEEEKVTGLIKSIRDGRLRLDQYLFGFHDDRFLRLEDLCNMLRSGSTNQSVPMDSFLSTHPERPLSLDELLNNFEGDLHVQGIDRQIRQSITNLRAKLSSPSTRLADRSSSLLRLGDALLRRFSQWAQKDDLEEAIWSYKEALSLIPNSHYYYLEALLGLCSSLYQRYYLLGHADDLKNLLLYLNLQCDIFNRQHSLLAPVDFRLCSPSSILDATSIAQSRAFQFIPGSYNSNRVFFTALGQASLSYAYLVPSSYFLRRSALSDPGLPFILLKPDKFVPHHGTLFPAFADLATHCIFNTSQLGWGGGVINDASSCLHLSVLNVVDDAQPGLFNPTFDWSRHLPSNVLDRQTHDRVLDCLFKSFTPWCLRIVPAFFLRDTYRALCIPHALTVLLNYHSSQGDQTLGYTYFGMSTRVSQALDSNLDFSEWVKLGLIDEAERLDRHRAVEVPTIANPRGLGPCNMVCDPCARKKMKCDGIKPLSQPCHCQGRQKTCTWLKNTVREPLKEVVIEAMHKQVEILRKYNSELWQYANSLESLQDECRQYHHPRIGHDDGHFLFSTITYQLALKVPGLRQHVNHIMELHPTLHTKSMDVQLRFLIIDAFRQLSPLPQRPYLVLIDELDECHDKATQQTILRLLCETIAVHKLPLRFLTGSRPESHIRDSFDQESLYTVTRRVILDEKFNPGRDIQQFLRDGFAKICAKNSILSHVKHPWPMEGVIDFLVQRSSGHFIYAATVLKFVGVDLCCPTKQLALVLNPDAMAFSDLDQLRLYTQILSVYPSAVNIIQVLGVISASVSHGKLAEVTEDIFGIEEGELKPVLRGLSSLINLYNIDDCWDATSYVIPHFAHASFGDYLFSSSHSDLFHVNQEEYKNQLTMRRFALIIQSIRVSSIARVHASTWDYFAELFFTECLTGRFKRSPEVVGAEIMTDINDLVQEFWTSSLKSRLAATPHILMDYWWIFILLHRPFFDRKLRSIHIMDCEIDHVKLCRHAADHVLGMLSTWRAINKLRYCPVTVVENAFSAGTVYLQFLLTMQASSGTCITRKEFRHSLEQDTLVHQYLQEIGLSWNCTTNISVTLSSLVNERVRPLLDLLCRKSISTTAGLHISADVGGDEEAMTGFECLNSHSTDTPQTLEFSKMHGAS